MTPVSILISRQLLAATLLAAVTGCPGGGETHESGQECWDGKDNDNDGAVDCNDPDCKAMAICSNGRQDAGKDLALDTRPISQDIHKPPPPDTYVAPPDKPLPASSYGQRCSYSSRNQLCADGKTYCILGKKSQTKGYCTYPCNGRNYDSCPAGPAGTVAKCLFNFAGTNYCAFLCKYLGKNHSCPSTLGCYYFSLNQKFCWP